jgi:hypothetical protein
MTTVINFFGAAGCAKSTHAADLYSYMKKRQYDVELIQEHVKFNWVYEGKSLQPFDELNIIGNQSYMETRLFNKVDYIITDSPVYLVSLYSPLVSPPAITEALTNLVETYYQECARQGIKYKNFFIQRNQVLNPIHRFQKTQEEVLKLDKTLKDMLDDFNYLNHDLLAYKDIPIDFEDWQQYFINLASI